MNHESKLNVLMDGGKLKALKEWYYLDKEDAACFILNKIDEIKEKKRIISDSKGMLYSIVPDVASDCYYTKRIEYLDEVENELNGYLDKISQ